MNNFKAIKFQHGQDCCTAFVENFPKIEHLVHIFLKNFCTAARDKKFTLYFKEDLGNSYLFLIPLPGRFKDDVKVYIINNHINVKAKKAIIPEREKLKSEKTVSKRGHFFYDFILGEADFDIELPSDANKEAIKTKLANGLLKITIAKKEPKMVDIGEDKRNDLEQENS